MRDIAGSVVVVGDCLLDIDTDGEASRLCPDAPVPVVDATGDRHRPGGAGLAAILAARQSRRVVLVTPLGKDDAAERLSRLLGGEVTVVALPLDGETVCKHRIRAGRQSVVRVDRGRGRAAGPIPARVDEVFASAHAILVADYGRGTTDLPEIRQLLAERIAAGTPVVWDPHPHGPAPVAGCRVVTPNASEAASFFGAAEPVEEAAQFLRTRWEAGAVAVTCAGDGATLADGLRCQRIPVPDQPLSTVDSCGAGDCFAATVAGGLADGLPVIEAVAEAVRAATSFVAAGGAAALSIVDSAATDGMNELDIARLRRSGGRLVAAGGCFDLLHPGHVNLLRQARDLGDALIVCVNSDESVRRRKGPGRPILPVADRVRLLEALETVDAVAVFEQDTPTELLDRLRPDIWVKGGDYVGQDLPEAEVVRRHGGDVVFVPLLDGYSTTRLARALQEAR